MGLLDPRKSYKPFEYPQILEFHKLQRQSFWVHTEVSLLSDVKDYKLNLTESEKNLINHILKGFVTNEILIEDYWMRVASWFKKPEIAMTCALFSAFESLHILAYAYLNETLGIDNFEEFLNEPSAKAKIDRMVNTKGETKADIARSLAVFSAFNEGVNLFSSFAILLNFQRFDKLKGIGQLIAFSAKDEDLHSTCGTNLLRLFINEYPDIWTDELKKDIYDAARFTVELEDAFIDRAFSYGEIEGINSAQMKNYIRFRTDLKLNECGLKNEYGEGGLNIIDQKLLTEMDWFHILVSGVSMQDFFSGRVVEYSKGNVDFSGIWDD